MNDPFISKDNSYFRLIREYDTHGSLVVGFDFDDTLHDYHKRGSEFPALEQLLRDLKSIGCRLICWTAYPDHSYVQRYLHDHNIPCDGINIDGISLGYESRKPFFSTILDDRVGLHQVYTELSNLVVYAKAKRLLTEVI